MPNFHWPSDESERLSKSGSRGQKPIARCLKGPIAVTVNFLEIFSDKSAFHKIIKYLKLE